MKTMIDLNDEALDLAAKELGTTLILEIRAVVPEMLPAQRNSRNIGVPSSLLAWR
jgi:hypothetical protein